MPFLTIAIPTSTAESVRATLQAPVYGHPAHADVATGHGPCRHCLRTFRIGEERRILFTHDPFAGVEKRPLPGPVFIHEQPCERYREDQGFPADLRPHALALNAYARGRRLLAQEYVLGQDVETTIESLLTRPEIDYIHVSDEEAGCFDLRIERQSPSTCPPIPR